MFTTLYRDAEKKPRFAVVSRSIDYIKLKASKIARFQPDWTAGKLEELEHENGERYYRLEYLATGCNNQKKLYRALRSVTAEIEAERTGDRIKKLSSVRNSTWKKTRRKRIAYLL